MTLNSILKTDRDRIFIVDSECIILFTGDSLDDEKPFIRIGNWIDMPVELIPLVENIIITDSLLGSPSFEQFNIDILELRNNRYIGSQDTLHRFLSFQKTFDLDLSNAHVINVEKDIPELNSGQCVSSKEEFIGIFYRNGNVKIQHKGKEFFGLHKEIENIHTNSDKLTLLAEEHRNQSRFNASGCMLSGSEPIFYHRGNLYPFFLSPDFIQHFSVLGINPERIKNIIFPSNTYLYLDELLKWQNEKQISTTVFTDNPEEFQKLRNLFPRIQFQVKPFSTMSFESDDGLQIQHYRNSFNLKYDFNYNSTEKKISIPYIRSALEIENILNDEIDAILVPYTTYERINLLLKGYDVPVLVAEDGNPGIKKLFNNETIIIWENCQYIFSRSEDPLSLSPFSGIDISIFKELANSNTETLAKEIAAQINAGSNNIKMHNLMSLCRLFLFSSNDRVFSQKLKELYQNIQRRIDRNKLKSEAEGHKIFLNFNDTGVFSFIEAVPKTIKPLVFHEIPADVPRIVSSSVKVHEDLISDYNLIQQDRERLKKLLALYINNTATYQTKKQITELKKELTHRKNRYRTIYKKLLAGKSDKTSTSSPTPMTRKCYTSSMRSTKTPLYLIIAGLLFISLFFVFLHYKSDQKVEKISKVKTEVLDERVDIKKLYKSESDTIKKYDIKITNIDIFTYANRVAVKNGYSRIDYKNLQGKNPHWIYPGNIFVLHDESRIIVRQGDTLWQISQDKLIEMSVKFYKLIEKFDPAQKKESQKILELAKEFAFSRKLKEKLEKLERQLAK